MAKRSIKLNPADVRDLGRDVDSIIHGSAPAIDAVYDEYDDADRSVANIEFFIESLQANKEPVTREMRARLVQSKKRVRDLDGRIAQYTKATLRRLKKRMAIIRASPGAEFNKDEIRKVDARILRIERKSDVRGYDVRPELTSLTGDVITLEQDSGIVLRRPSVRKSAAEVQRSKEASLYSKLVKVWKDTYKDAKDDPRVQEDVAWIQAQLHAMDRKFKRNESISRLGSLVTKRVGDLRRRIDSYKAPKTHRAAKKATGEFVVQVQEYALGGDATSKGVDKMQLELGGLSRRFSAKDRAEWSRADQRSFASDLSRIRKALESLKPKGRKKNPCIGLHFHGKDAGDLLKSLEDSSERQQKQLKKNPAAKTKTPTITESEYYKKADNYDGFCLACNRFIKKRGHGDGFEPDIEGRECRYCGKNKAVGIELAQAMGRIHVKNTNPKRVAKKNPTKNPSAERKNPLFYGVTQARARLNDWLRKRGMGDWRVEDISYDSNRPGEIKGLLLSNGSCHLDMSYRPDSRMVDYELSDSEEPFASERNIEPGKSAKADMAAAVKWATAECKAALSPYFNKENPKRKNPKTATKKATKKNPSANLAEEMLLAYIQGPYENTRADLADTWVPLYGSKAAFNRTFIAAKKSGLIKEKAGLVTLTSKGAKQAMQDMDTPKRNPKGTKKNPAKKKPATPKWRAEVNRCRKLWDTYCDKPTKKNLRLVLAHLDKMKGSTIKAVKSERARCSRVANKEAKRLKM